MAIFICAYSGLEVKTSHFPLYLSARTNTTATHPIFHAPQKTLLSYAGKWSNRELSSHETYLLFLALLNSTELVHFRVPAQFTSRELLETEYGASYTNLGTDAITNANMEFLMRTIVGMNRITAPLTFPQIIITPETCSLWNAKHWIESWDAVLKDYAEGSRKSAIREEFKNRELALARLIKSSFRKPESYATLLADWTDDVVGFPTFMVTNLTGEQIPLNSYYKDIIIHAARGEFHKINKPDLFEMMDCIFDSMDFSLEKSENTGAGSIHSFTLFQILKETKKHFQTFVDCSRPAVVKRPIGETWRFAEEGEEETEETEFAPGLQKLIAETPKEKPEQVNFSSRVEYIKAKIKWDAAQTATNRLSGKNNLGF